MKYKEYINSLSWKITKDMAYEKKYYACSVCGRKPPIVSLELHHITFENIYNEKMEDLRWLCSSCHKYVHENKISTIYEFERSGSRKPERIGKIAGNIFKKIGEKYE